MNPPRGDVRELKAALITALDGKLPIKDGVYKMESAASHLEGDTFLNIKVKDQNGNVLTYLVVTIREALS